MITEKVKGGDLKHPHVPGVSCEAAKGTCSLELPLSFASCFLILSLALTSYKERANPRPLSLCPSFIPAAPPSPPPFFPLLPRKNKQQLSVELQGKCIDLEMGREREWGGGAEEDNFGDSA